MDRPHITERSTSLRHFLTVVFRRMWVILSITALALLVGGFQLWRMPPQYEAQSKLLLERDPELEKALLLRISSGSRSEEASFSYTQESEIMTSRPVLERVIRQLKLYGFDDTTRFADAAAREAALQMALKDMNSSLSIVPSPDPNIIKVKYKSAHPQLSAAIVNELVSRYIEYRFEIFSDDQTIAFLDRQIEAAAGNLNELQQKRATFQSQGTLYSPDKEGNLLFSRLGDYENRADAIKLERISKESKLRALRDIVASGSFMELPAIDLGANNPQMQNVIQLKEQLRTLEYDRAQMRQKYTESYVEVQEKTAAIESLRQRINAEITEIINVLEAGVQALLHEEQTLRGTAESIRSQIRGLSGKELEMAKLSRGITETEELYSLLSKQREEARISRSKKEMVVRVKVISAATVPQQPLPGNRVAKIFIILFLGLFAGVSLAFFMDFFDHSFKNAEDVQRYLGLDILASVRSFQKP